MSIQPLSVSIQPYGCKDNNILSNRDLQREILGPGQNRHFRYISQTSGRSQIKYVDNNGGKNEDIITLAYQPRLSKWIKLRPEVQPASAQQ